jgi:hypothetical protein
LLDVEHWQDSVSGPHGVGQWQLSWRDRFGDSLGATPLQFTLAAGAAHQHSRLTPLAGAVSVTPFYVTHAEPTSHDEWHLHFRAYCGGADPDSPVEPCSQSDPLWLQPQLDRIEALVTLIQRQAVPFAYVPSSEHSGLTGEGSISVQGLIGARIELTSWEANVGELAGDPDVIAGAGWINWGNSDGVTTREFLSAQSQVSLPAAAGQYTELHYSLALGVVATITELEREP